MTKKQFQQTVWNYYNQHGRVLPWRLTDGTQKSAYKILVSEIMLQQTQVDRVIPKYTAFLKKFPSIQKLAQASNAEVLALWSGLGYNRRALFLKRAAETVVEKYHGKIPQTLTELQTLPGIGPYTASAVGAFAWNIPSGCIETNIRTAYLYHFFSDRIDKVHDSELLPLIQKTCDTENPREWYWAFMDYGSMLKSSGIKIHRNSISYTKQKAFTGSLREVRGAIMKVLVKEGKITATALVKKVSFDKDRIDTAIKAMQKDGIIKIDKNTICLD